MKIKEYNKIQWFFLSYRKKIHNLIDLCIVDKRALHIKSKNYEIRLDFKTNEIEVYDLKNEEE